MANYQPLIGFQPLAGTLQAPLASVSKAVETIAEEFALDNTLPVLGEIMTDGRITYVTVPKFRAVGIKARSLVNSKMPSNSAGVKPVLTIATGGGTVDPVGVAQFDLYKEFNNVPQGMQSVFEKRQYIRFPFVGGVPGAGNTTYNSNVNGQLNEGSPVAPDSYGRPSLFVPKVYITKVYKVTSTNDAAIPIKTDASANVPYSVSVLNVKTGVDVTANATVSFATANTIGTISVAPDADDVATDDILLITLEYGHSSTKKYGTVGRVLTGIDENTLAGFIRNQVQNDYPLAPIMNPVFTTSTSVVYPAAAETHPTHVGLTATSGEFSLGKQYIDLSKSLVVEFCADMTASTPVWVPLDNASMPRLYANTELGSEFAVNALSGTVEYFLSDAHSIASTNAAIRVSFSYKTAQSRSLWEQGAYGNGGTGIYGQTDGSVAGTFPVMKPAAAIHPDGADFAGMSVADMKLSGIMNIILD